MNDFSESPKAWKGPFDRAMTRLATSTRQTDLLLPGTPPPVELEVPISELPIAGKLFGDEMVPIVQNGITCRSTTAIVGAAGETPVLINKDMTLVYPVAIGQTVFALGSPDHYGRGFALSDKNALQVTIGGIRLIEDDGTGTWGQYTVDLHASTVTLLTPFGTDPVVIVGDGDVAVFDIFNVTYAPAPTALFSIDTRALTIVTTNVFPPLPFKPNGLMTTIYVNGVAFSDNSAPPSFSVSDRTITWLNTIYSVVPGDQVVVSYTYDTQLVSGGGGGGGGAGFATEAVTVTGINTLAPLLHQPDGGAFVLVVDGYSFVAVGPSPAFSYSGHTITWLSTTFTIGTGANVSATYSYISGT